MGSTFRMRFTGRTARLALIMALVAVAGIDRTSARAQAGGNLQYQTIRDFNANPEFVAAFGRANDSIAGFLKVGETVSFASLFGFPRSGFNEFTNWVIESSSVIDTVPLPSGSTSVTYEFDPKLEAFVRSERPLSPAISQNAPTNGRGVLTVGVSYSYLDFKHFDDFDNNRVVFSAGQVPIEDGDGNLLYVAEDALLYDFRLSEHVYGFSAQYGVLENLDVGVFIPVIDLSYRGQIVDRLFRPDAARGLVPLDLVCQDGSVDPSDPNCNFVVDGEGEPTFRRLEDIDITGFQGQRFTQNFIGVRHDEDKTGIGDVILRGKYWIGSMDKLDAGILLNVSLPTGDEDNLFGVGAVRFDPRLLLSLGNDKISSHVNAGFHADAEDSDRDRFDFSLGGEVRLTSRVSLMLDEIGRVRIFGKEKTKKFELVPGIKFNPYRDIVLSFNAIVPLNRDGLTTDWIPNGIAEASFTF